MNKVLKIIFAYILSCLIVVTAVNSSVTADTTSGGTVDSMDDYYDKIVRQIYDRDAYRYYTVKNKAFRKSLVGIDMDRLEAHYNKDEPLVSGCYLIHYIKTIYTNSDSAGVKVKIRFPYNKGSMDSHFAMMDRLAGILKGKNDYETVLNVHKYLIKNFEFDYRFGDENYTDIDGFKDGVMVCTGYSLATYYLLNKNGVETRLIHGYGGKDPSGPCNHMWNMVKLDGKWYNLDVTWDDLGGENITYDYFLKSDNDFPMHIRMAGFEENGVSLTVSERSYKHPFRIDNPEDLPRLLFALFILGIVVFIIYKKIIVKKNERIISQVVVNTAYDELDKEMDIIQEQYNQKVLDQETNL